MSELESMVGGDNAEADGNVTYIDASGEECSTPSDLSYKSKTGSSSGFTSPLLVSLNPHTQTAADSKHGE